MMDLNELVETPQLTKKGVPRKRKPKNKNFYFTEETEESIIKYRNTKNVTEKNKIYNDHIHHALYKLSENIIHTFKFYHTDVERIEDLKYEVISFMLQKIDLYDKSKGKAYSYFGTIAKRYLILYNQKNYKKSVAKIDLSEIHNDENTVSSLIDPVESQEIDRYYVVEDLIEKLENQILEVFDKPEEIEAAYAILEILKKRQKISVFNKKAIFIYVKEMVDVSSNTITKVIKRIKSMYKEVLIKHFEK